MQRLPRPCSPKGLVCFVLAKPDRLPAMRVRHADIADLLERERVRVIDVGDEGEQLFEVMGGIHRRPHRTGRSACLDDAQHHILLGVREPGEGPVVQGRRGLPDTGHAHEVHVGVGRHDRVAPAIARAVGKPRV